MTIMNGFRWMDEVMFWYPLARGWAVRLARKPLHDKTKKRTREGFFENIGNCIIEGNHQGNPVTFNLDLSHMQPERTALAELEFKNRDIDDIDATLLIEDRVRSPELRLQLNKLHVPRGLHKKLISARDDTKKQQDSNSSYWKSETGLQCPVLDPASRQYSYLLTTLRS
jgi:hypothetical protein